MHKEMYIYAKHPTFPNYILDFTQIIFIFRLQIDNTAQKML